MHWRTSMAEGWTPGRPNGGSGPFDPLEEARRLLGQYRGSVPTGGAPPSGPAKWPLPPWAVAAIAVILWLASGFFIVAPEERGIVLRVGRAVREAPSGPGYHLPWPIEEVLKPSVTRIRKEEFGFRTVSIGPPAE